MKEKIQHNTEVSIHELLEHYTNWLVKKGYTDTDPIYEEPLAVDEYLKENPPANFLKEYADWKIKECLPEKEKTEFTSYDDYDFAKAEIVGWNACIDNILINADIKCKGCKQERCQCGKTHNEPYSGFDAVA